MKKKSYHPRIVLGMALVFALGQLAFLPWSLDQVKSIPSEKVLHAEQAPQAKLPVQSPHFSLEQE